MANLPLHVRRVHAPGLPGTPLRLAPPGGSLRPERLAPARALAFGG